MLADVTCFEADVDVAWVWRAGINDFVRHENTRVTRELLNAAGVRCTGDDALARATQPTLPLAETVRHG